MLTIFRCFIGDCSSREGTPLIYMLMDVYGAPIVLLWLTVMILVIFGLFNLIMAIYLENTLAVAKSQEESLKTQKKEALRVAKNIKRLCTIFCMAQHKVNEGTSLSVINLHDFLDDSNDDAGNLEMEITRDTFLVVTQYRTAQKLMDDLDIPSERARLFDVLDADGNGALCIQELISGLLRVRGESQRSDILAAVLGVRAVLSMIRQVQDGMIASQDDLRMKMQELCADNVSVAQTKACSTDGIDCAIWPANMTVERSMEKSASHPTL